MRQRLFLGIGIFIFFLPVFFLQKIAFVLFLGKMNENASIADIPDILYHGLPLDMSLSGYLTIIPLLLIIASVWINTRYLYKILNGYFLLVSFLIALIAIVDIIVYPYWGFHFDTTVLFYLKNPEEAFASASILQIITGTIAVIISTFIIYFCYSLIIKKPFIKFKASESKIKTSIVLFLFAGILFLPIRGGVTVSTMNIGHAYYSESMFLNHAAVNPIFNLMYSLKKSDDFASQYQFYDSAEAKLIFKHLHEQPVNDSIPELLTTTRPNILFFILESFSYDVALDSVTAPNMHSFAKEGILFNQFFANSFRTDRGLVSILSGYPAHPTTAILKYPKKTGSLPTIPRSLRQAGYENFSMYYGGDINFANMRSYFVGACGIKDIISDDNFSIKDRLTKWGVPDKPLIEKVYNDLTTKPQNNPFLKIILTLSSHEPFDVPITKFNEPFLNSVNYTDECLGNFVEKLKKTDLWDNTLIIFISDHAMQGYPRGTQNNEQIRFHIPMIWIGGVIKQPAVISEFGSQNDLASTLLSQLQIDHSDYEFSKDMLNPESNKFAFYSYSNGFSMIDSSGVFTFDNDLDKIINNTGNPNMEKNAKALFQSMYLDLGNR